MLCVIMSDLVLAAVPSAGIPTDPEVYWTVLCEQAAKDTIRVLSNAISWLFSHLSLKISETLLHMKFRSEIIAIGTHSAVMCFF